MNNNKLDERALLAHCKGVFAATSYLFPDPYADVKDIARDSYKHKQFGTEWPKPGKTIDVYFEKKHNWVFDGEKYVDRNTYADKGMDKQLGFHSSDYPKRDEFSNTIRTEQHRQQLRAEAKLWRQQQHFCLAAAQQLTEEERRAQEANDKLRKAVLFDLLHQPVQASGTGASVLVRDTKNPTALSKQRNLGPYRTSYTVQYEPRAVRGRPEHARVPLIRDTFMRKMDVGFHLEAGHSKQRLHRFVAGPMAK